MQGAGLEGGEGGEGGEEGVVGGYGGVVVAVVVVVVPVGCGRGIGSRAVGSGRGHRYCGGV